MSKILLVVPTPASSLFISLYIFAPAEGARDTAEGAAGGGEERRRQQLWSGRETSVSKFGYRAARGRCISGIGANLPV